MEERLIELETRFAYQEDTLRVLDQVVAAQQSRIAALEALCRDLAEKLARTAEGGFKLSPEDEVPPHY
jgi:SlyX protein